MGNFHNLSQDSMKGKPQHYLISITFRLMPSEHKKMPASDNVWAGTESRTAADLITLI